MFKLYFFSIEKKETGVNENIPVLIEPAHNCNINRTDYLVKFAADRRLDTSRDELGNLIIRKPATAEVAAIHAGLECGYWAYKKPGISDSSAWKTGRRS